MARNVLRAWEDMNRTINQTHADNEIKQALRPRPFSINSRSYEHRPRVFTASIQPAKEKDNARLTKVVPFSTKPELMNRNKNYAIKPIKRIQTAKERSETKALKNLKYLYQKFQSIPINFFVDIYHRKIMEMQVS